MEDESVFDVVEDRASGPRPEGNTRVNPEYYTERDTLLDRHRRLKTPSATVLNMNPYPLRLNSAQLGHILIPACPADQDFVSYTFKDVLIEPRPVGDGKYAAHDTVPLILAEAYVLHQAAHEPARGGVVVFQGNIDPSRDSTVKEQIETARAIMLRYAKHRYRAANNEYNQPGHPTRNISEMDRQCALLLMRAGELAEAPQWLDPSVVEANKGEQCPLCRVRPEAGAALCVCGFVLDPRAAYEHGVINVEDVAMTRLDRQTLKQMGISELIPETLSERNKRNKQEATKAKAAA